MVNALMFARIDELKDGEDFYIKIMGETLAYRIDSITVILPTEGNRYLRIQPGEDRATLMTCTPYGVNTHRLLVSGRRVSMPVPVPYPPDARGDVRMLAVVIGFVDVALVLVGWTVLQRRFRWMLMRHAADRHGW